jgi:hypothetical protein
VRKNKSLPGSRLLFFVLVGPVLWFSVLIWPSVAHSQQEMQQQETHRPTHYVIVVRNTSLNVPGAGELISRSAFRTAMNSIPMGLEAASGQIPLWRKPEPGDLISVVFAAAGKDPKPFGQTGCESPHYPDPAASGQTTRLEPGTYFDVRARIPVEGHNSPSDVADPSSKLHQELLQSLVVKDCDLIANTYSEGLTLAKGLTAVEVDDAKGEEKYKQFFLLVFDFASPAYGSTEFSETFDVSHGDLAPETPAYLIAPTGSLKFTDGEWSLDLINYLDYPAEEPGGTSYLRRDNRKFYPRLRFYRAVAHDASLDPFYDLANAQHEIAQLKPKIDDSTAVIESLENRVVSLERQLEASEQKRNAARISAFAAWTAAAAFALLVVLVAWRWWAIKGRFRRMAEGYQKDLERMREEQSRLTEKQKRDLLEFRRALDEEFREKQAALEAEKGIYKSLLTGAVCIPDAPGTKQVNEYA